MVTMVGLKVEFKDWRLLRAVNPSVQGWEQAPRWRHQPPPLLPTAVHCKHLGGSMRSAVTLQDTGKLAAEEVKQREQTLYTWLFIGSDLLPGLDWQWQGLGWHLRSSVQNHQPATWGHETKPPIARRAPGPC